MVDDLGTDLDQFLPQRGQRPVFDLLRQCKRPHEVAQIVSQGMKLQANLVVAELAAGQPCPLDGVLSLFDVLFRRATMIVEGDNPFGRTRQVGDDEANTRVQFAGMPFHLGNDTAFCAPRSRLIAEVGIIAPHMIWRTTDRTDQQMGNALLENLVGLKANCVEETRILQELVDVRRSECSVSSEVAAQVPFPVTLNEGSGTSLQQSAL